MHALIPYLIVAFIYLAVAADYWRVAKQSEKNFTLHSAMVALGLALHGWLLYSNIFGDGFNLGFYNILSAIFWLTVVIYWVLDFKHQLYSLQAFVLPPAALFALLPALISQNHYLAADQSGMLMTHIGIALLAYSLFTFATLHALLMAVAERYMHKKSSVLTLPDFPPILVLENVLFKVLHIGFALLTITLISGMLFSEEIFGKAAVFNHKTVFSIASWLIYAWLLIGRHRFGWRGRKAIKLTLIGFALLLLAYVGSRFILWIVLGK